MEQKFIRAFGYIFTQNFYPKGFRFKLIPKEIVTCTIFFSKGFLEARDVKTNQLAPQPSQPGVMFYHTDYTFKEYDCCAIEPTVVYCYDELMNNNEKLNLIPIDLTEGVNVVFENNTRFLLCEGVLNIEETKFNSPSAVSITTGDKNVIAETHCFGIKLL